MKKAEIDARLAHAVAFLAAAVFDCRAKRLFAGLYAADVVHFSKTGRQITEQEYLTGPWGPYPEPLKGFVNDREIPGSLVTLVRDGETRYTRVLPVEANIDLGSHFSVREVDCLKLAAALMRSSMLELELVSSIDGGACQRIFTARGKHKKIEMEETVAADAPNREDILARAASYRGRRARLLELATIA